MEDVKKEGTGTGKTFSLFTALSLPALHVLHGLIGFPLFSSRDTFPLSVV